MVESANRANSLQISIPFAATGGGQYDIIKAAVAAMHNPDAGVYGACLRGKPVWGDNMAFVTTVVTSSVVHGSTKT